uniref:Uncharacterized protein n=1 Tax=Anguilla anguilla TaxID=7936 RepID=A0A0E9SHN2_ANGAN
MGYRPNSLGSESSITANTKRTVYLRKTSTAGPYSQLTGLAVCDKGSVVFNHKG